jgi:hypothetical protein
MRIAIVGSSRLNKKEEQVAKQIITLLLKEEQKNSFDLVVISGGAKGVDSLAEKIAKDFEIKTTIFLPENEHWEPNGYKERNLKIVNNCDRLYSIVTAIKDQACYHCVDVDKFPHQRSGACWTRNQAIKKKILTKRFII